MMAEQPATNRVTKEMALAAIVSETFTVLPDGRTTVCQLTLKNGFSVHGISSCVAIENFDKELGEKYAREDAMPEVFLLEAYLLKERMFKRGIDAQVESIARMCHEVNRAYCLALGDTSQVGWGDAPDWQKDSAKLGVKLHLTNPDAGPQASHESWMDQKLAEGWVYGDKKDPDAKTHPCICGFDQLPREQQAKDFIFRAVVLAAEEA